MADERINQIRAYEEKIRELEASDKNAWRLSHWTSFEGSEKNQPHAIPVESDKLIYLFNPDFTGIASYLDFSLVKFYTDPVEYVLRSLQRSIFMFETFDTLNPVGRVISYWAGVGFEPSVFGMPQEITEEDAWVGREHIIKERIPPGEIAIPDFHNNKATKDALDFWTRMKETVSDDFDVYFPTLYRSPWGIAWALRGIEDLLVDCIEDPEWAKALVDRIADCRISWDTERAKYLGEPGLAPSNVYNDEVAAPTISPDIYRNIIFPSEERISRVYGGINYWHSCGDTTPFYEDLNRLPNVGILQVSPWSDLDKAVPVYDKPLVLEYALHPMADVMVSEDNRGVIDEKLLAVREKLRGRRALLRSDGWGRAADPQYDIKRLQYWISRANEILLS